MIMTKKYLGYYNIRDIYPISESLVISKFMTKSYNAFISGQFLTMMKDGSSAPVMMSALVAVSKLS